MIPFAIAPFLAAALPLAVEIDCSPIPPAASGLFYQFRYDFGLADGRQFVGSQKTHCTLHLVDPPFQVAGAFAGIFESFGLFALNRTPMDARVDGPRATFVSAGGVPVSWVRVYVDTPRRDATPRLGAGTATAWQADSGPGPKPEVRYVIRPPKK